MQGTVSFHPIDPSFFAKFIEPLVAGDKINPDHYVGDSLRHRRVSFEISRFIRAIEILMEQNDPPPAPDGAKPWENNEAERYDIELARKTAVDYLSSTFPGEGWARY